ncbi:MAG: hypothetical protein Q8Q89_05170 [bacterium]|nr:hypothetical protein [bacterium]
MVIQAEPRLRKIDESEKFASPGKFRLVALFSSGRCQIGEDADTVEEATVLMCRAMTVGSSEPFHVYDDNLFKIYDDKGNDHLWRRQ